MRRQMMKCIKATLYVYCSSRDETVGAYHESEHRVGIT